MPHPIPMETPVACREGVGELLTDAWYTDESSWDNPFPWIAVTIQSKTDTI